MCMQDGTEILKVMGSTYPDSSSLVEVGRQTAFGGTRMRRAVADLVRGGFIEVRPSSRKGLPRLTEAGMAVAFGLACADAARDKIAALERATLCALDEQRTRGCRAPPPDGSSLGESPLITAAAIKHPFLDRRK